MEIVTMAKIYTPTDLFIFTLDADNLTLYLDGGEVIRCDKIEYFYNPGDRYVRIDMQAGGTRSTYVFYNVCWTMWRKENE